MIHPLPVPVYTVYQNAASVANIADNLDVRSDHVDHGGSGFKLAAAGASFFQSNTLPLFSSLAADAGKNVRIRNDSSSLSSPPFLGRGGIRHWLSIVASVYGLSSVLSCVLLVFILKYDERRFYTET